MFVVHVECMNITGPRHVTLSPGPDRGYWAVSSLLCHAINSEYKSKREWESESESERMRVKVSE